MAVMHSTWLQPTVAYGIACFAGFCVSDAIALLDALPPTMRCDVLSIVYARIQATDDPSKLFRVVAINSAVVDTTIQLQLVQPTMPWPVTVVVDWIPRWVGSAMLAFWPCAVTSLEISLPPSLVKTDEILAGITEDENTGFNCMWLASSPVQSLTLNEIDFGQRAAITLARIISHSTTLKSLVLYDTPASWRHHSQLTPALSDASTPPLPPQLTPHALHLTSLSITEVAAWGTKIAASQLSTLTLELSIPRDLTAIVCNALALPTMENLSLRCVVLTGTNASGLRRFQFIGCSLFGQTLATVVEIIQTSEVLEDIEFKKYNSIPPSCVAAIAAALPAWTTHEFVHVLPCVRNSSRFALRLRDTKLATRDKKHLVAALSDVPYGTSDAEEQDVAAYAQHVGVLMVDATTFYAPLAQLVSKKRQT
ncbi:hypothetical protein SPRG_08843 [Saprolegnia parasitica CBS 223.65]|uniref:Uncharacterized protein n=1 Tax=Saprolegnia parasitica (strain CBS 223.65) TaxID=695850 RepID=A0A067CGF4_SAPPC|nr:hypothetical protein SPRG_08843 [Saprolegnia parasitica CBS 223.65]KDO25902.1 hypothetical protein SPRG_08843 [Saprolegnia parasitica CBS 223.65]|eukprot:XP_012203462.1 hypothetical protein SPRG_08843 [Saprolegnia parasitica CBS 223.65]